MQVTIDRPVRDEGSVVVFAATDEAGEHHWIAVDHRCAQDIVYALAAGEEVEVDVEPWQIIAHVWSE